MDKKTIFSASKATYVDFCQQFMLLDYIFFVNLFLFYIVVFLSFFLLLCVVLF